jgi:hypothetical protein
MNCRCRVSVEAAAAATAGSQEGGGGRFSSLSGGVNSGREGVVAVRRTIGVAVEVDFGGWVGEKKNFVIASSCLCVG